MCIATVRLPVTEITAMVGNFRGFYSRNGKSQKKADSGADISLALPVVDGSRKM